VSGVGDSFARLVVDGPFVVAALVAAVAGLVSFLSPCVLPLVPGYLSYVGGLSGTEANAATDGTTAGGGVATRTRVRSRTVLGAMLFVLGFTAVFVTYGVLFGRLGSALIEHQRLLERILGVVVILLGLAFLGWLPGVSRELRIHRFPSAGLVGAPLLGIVFGLGWTPCIGPTLGAVQSLALSTAGAGRGAALSAAYCIGLGVPFELQKSNDLCCRKPAHARCASSYSSLISSQFSSTEAISASSLALSLPSATVAWASL